MKNRLSSANSEPNIDWRRWRDGFRDGLLNDVVPFWRRHGIDPRHGGLYSSLDRDGSLLDADKAIWIQGRATWLLATLYRDVEKNPEWLEDALCIWDFLEKHGTDARDGLMWFQVTEDGRPIRKRRYRFSEAFAAMGAAALFGATGRAVFADSARARFETFRRHADNPSLAPQGPKFEPTRPSVSIGPEMIALNIAQVFRENGIPGDWSAFIDQRIDFIAKHFVRDDIQSVLEIVDPERGLIPTFNGRTLNPGHAIEAAWFILHEAALRHDDRYLTNLGTKMLDWMWTRGWDSEFGGLFYFVSVDDRPIEEYWADMKFWWPHNEAMIACLLAYRLTRETRFASRAEAVYTWMMNHFPDPEHGEWFGYLHRDGAVAKRLKGNTWKGPFHIPRMQWMGWRLCEDRLKERAP